MIEPFRSGEALVSEIETSRSSAGVETLFVWWLGQSGLVLKFGTAVVVVDPYLSEHLTKKYADTGKPHVRMTRAPLRGADLRGVDLVLTSHKHSDHLDPGTLPGLLTASANAKLLLPSSLEDYAVELGLPSERLVGLDTGSTFRQGGVSVRAIASAHEGLDRDASGRHLYLGFVIELGSFRIYHAGDGIVYEGLAEALGPAPFDVLFLPVNGRDPRRGVSGNMTASEAVDFAIRIRPRFVVPMHYDMFTFNTIDIGEFTAEAKRLPSAIEPRVLRCGECWEVHR